MDGVRRRSSTAAEASRTTADIVQGGFVGLARFANGYGGRSGERNRRQALQTIEPLIYRGQTTMLLQDFQSVLTQAQTAPVGSLAQDLVKVVRQVPDLEMNRHEA